MHTGGKGASLQVRFVGGGVFGVSEVKPGQHTFCNVEPHARLLLEQFQFGNSRLLERNCCGHSGKLA